MFLIKTRAGREFYASGEFALQDLINWALSFGGAVLYAGGLKVLKCTQNGRLINIRE